ncbi:MAG: hypothetical protein OEL83_05300 [Desulforhopalus sp.]|nr:hypothetical protein [Desulforhopalus sp.]
MKKISYLLLATLMICSCSSNQLKEEDFYGEWEGRYDMRKDGKTKKDISKISLKIGKGLDGTLILYVPINDLMSNEVQFEVEGKLENNSYLYTLNSETEKDANTRVMAKCNSKISTDKSSLTVDCNIVAKGGEGEIISAVLSRKSGK